MGSSKKKSKKRVVEAPDLPIVPERAVGTAPALDPRDASALADVRAALADLDRRLDLLARQLERTLLLHERTNTLLELLAGSAFDMELDGPAPR